MADDVPPPPPSGPSVGRYGLAVGITVFVILSQYFVPELLPVVEPVYGSLVGDFLVVYGVPIVAFLGLVGLGPLRHWRHQMGLAALEGLRWNGALTLASLFVVAALTVVYLAVDPGALALLSRTNPALAEASGNPWLFVALSFAIGAIEETIFRGWIFGFWTGRGGWWVVPATWTSLLFAGVHLYYGTTYGIVAPLIFPTLFFLGFAFAATFRASGGNLVVVALLHGVFDASAFLTLVNYDAGVGLRYLIVLVGVVLFLLFWVRRPGSPWRPLGSVEAAFRAGPDPTRSASR
jgi:membrane protease YdiL (CAAX protease family)